MKAEHEYLTDFNGSVKIIESDWTEFAKAHGIEIHVDSRVRKPGVENEYVRHTPLYARTPNERGLVAKSFRKELSRSEFEETGFYSVETEYLGLTRDEDSIFTIFRFYDGCGQCRRVAVVGPPLHDGKSSSLLQEDWISRDNWRVTRNARISRDEADEFVSKYS
jgi:hypothetical protein